MTYSSWAACGRTSVIVAWKSSTGVAAFTQRSSVAGPTIVVGRVNGAVWKAMPSAAGTGGPVPVGVGRPGVPPGAAGSVAGRTVGSKVNVVLPLDGGVCASQRLRRAPK